MRKHIYIVFSFLLLPLVEVLALPTKYVCDFENEAENRQWVVSEDSDKYHRWLIGEGVASEGKKSLYVSADGGKTASYTRNSAIKIAYREIELEEGDYDIAFDWQCVGDSSMIHKNKGVLQVAWVDIKYKDDKRFGGAEGNEDMERAWYKNSSIFKFNEEETEVLYNSLMWTGAKGSLHSDGKPHLLVFIFVTYSTIPVRNPGPCVDNIEIRRNVCGKPTNIRAETVGNNVKCMWTSSAEAFNLRLRNMVTGEVFRRDNLRDTTCQLTLAYGIYETSIQVICQGDTSVWYSSPSIIIYDNPCINYLNLTDSNCWFARKTNGTNYRDLDGVIKQKKVDYGYPSILSQHTIHYNPDEYDGRTVGSYCYDSVSKGWKNAPRLKTVPEGEIASVRIGSWDDAKIARVTYDFTVDAKEYGTVLIKYAMVVQSAGHDGAYQPRVYIDVVDAKTDEIIDRCVSIDLEALKDKGILKKKGNEGWNIRPASDINGESSATDVYWRDWRTLGLNLEEYDGRDLRIKITAYGCAMTAHYSYAYVVVKCVTSQLEGLQCGDTPTNFFKVPDGFDYHWYKLYDRGAAIPQPQPGNIFPVDFRDTTTYAVDVMNKEKKECSFRLVASAMPRYPIPEITTEVVQKDCKNYVRVINNCHIRKKNLNTGQIYETSTYPDNVEWNFDGLIPTLDATGSVPKDTIWLAAPSEANTYQLQVTAHVGLCDSSKTYRVSVPRVGPDSLVETVQACAGWMAKHNGQHYAADADVLDHGYNIAGCDSFFMHKLRFVETIRDTFHYEVGEGDTIIFSGKKYWQTTTDSSANKAVLGGCDSISYLELIVNEHLRLEAYVDTMPCADADYFKIKINRLQGVPSGYSLIFDTFALNNGFVNQKEDLAMTSTTKGGEIYVNMPSNIKPDKYYLTLHFASIKNGEQTITIPVEVRYVSSIIEQRWDDVLGILNERYNGGYEFESFQWYKNNIPVPDATKPYYYEEGGLDLNSTYAVALKRVGEQQEVRTCEFYPKFYPKDEDTSPKAKKILQDGKLYFLINGKIYNSYGYLLEVVK